METNQNPCVNFGRGFLLFEASMKIHPRATSTKGKYPRSVNGKDSAAYTKWYNMLHRCYGGDKRSKRDQKAYEGVTVCEPWLDYQTFADWFYSQPNHDHPKIHLDKDCIKEGNKVYCPEFCQLISGKLNTDEARKHRATPVVIIDGDTEIRYESITAFTKALGIHRSNIEIPKNLKGLKLKGIVFEKG